MPQNTTITLAPGVWTQITNADATAITFQVRPSAYGVFISGAVGAVAPVTIDGAILYGPNQGEIKAALADLFPGVAATRVYAYSDGVAAVMVSHA